MKFFEFFIFVYDWIFIIQLLTISLSLVLVFYPIKWKKQSMAIMACHVGGTFVLGTVLNWLLFALSGVWTWLAGVHYPLAWFITILVYLCFFSKIYIPSRIIMGATLFITVITMTTLGREIMKVIGVLGVANIGYYIAFVLIIAFSVLLRKYTLRNYSDIPVISVVLIAVNAVVSVILVLYGMMISMKDFFLANPQYCMILAALYIFSVTG